MSLFCAGLRRQREGACIARWSALAARPAVLRSGYQLDRRYGSGPQAIIDASMMVQTSAVDRCRRRRRAVEQCRILFALTQEQRAPVNLCTIASRAVAS